MEQPTLSQVRWRCRRGMLELDVLFNRFLDQGYADLSGEEVNDFVALLQQEDDVIWDWMLGRTVPEHPGIARIVERIRPSR